MLDGLLAGITSEDIDRMPRAYRQRFAQALRRAVDMLERPHAKPALEAEDDHAHPPGADMVQAA
jgi:phage terminase Nu1 subunit (DNA packaging protein)